MIVFLHRWLYLFTSNDALLWYVPYVIYGVFLLKKLASDKKYPFKDTSRTSYQLNAPNAIVQNLKLNG